MRQHAPRKAPCDAGPALGIADLDPACARPQAAVRFGKAEPALTCSLQALVDQCCRRQRDQCGGKGNQAERKPTHYCVLARVSVAVALTVPGAERASTRAAWTRTCCTC